MKLFFGVLAGVLAILVYCRAPLSWDGGWILFTILDARSPLIYGDRFTNAPLHALVLVVAHFTSNLRIIESVFSLIYAGIPVLSLAASWWVVRRERPGLFCWAAVGVGLGTLPGQFNFLSDCITAMNIFWPIYLSTLCGLPRRQRFAVMGLAAALFFIHPVAVPLFGCAAVAAALVGWRWPDVRRRMLTAAATFVVLAVAKLVVFIVARPSYDASEASVSMQVKHFENAVAGVPMEAIGCVWVAALGLYLLAQPDVRGRVGRWLAVVPWVALLLAGAILVRWAVDPARWAYALDFRDWALPFSFPMMALAALEAMTAPIGGDPRAALPDPRRLLAVQAVAVIFLAVLTVQSTVWWMMSSRLQEEIARRPHGCTTLDALGWPVNTALYHWATPAYATLLQGRTPHTLVLYKRPCAEGAFEQSMRFNYAFRVVHRDGWFVLPD